MLLSQNPPELTVEAPREVFSGSTFTVRTITPAKVPVPGVIVNFAGNEYITEIDGNVDIKIPEFPELKSAMKLPLEIERKVGYDLSKTTQWIDIVDKKSTINSALYINQIPEDEIFNFQKLFNGFSFLDRDRIAFQIDK